MRRISRSALLAAFVGLIAISCAIADENKSAPSDAVLKAGGETFMRYCALCHGLDGGGLGPLQDALQKAPPDLTRISERNGGKFPTEKIKEIIEHGGIKSHGMMAMLAWGKVFNEEIGGERQGEVIDNLTAYIESLQGR